jgi:type I restriction enzyme S subunit
MNAERLLAQFERISEAPDAIPRLRRFILDLAVRGKLVDQNPGDEPAGELLLQFQQSRRKSNAKGTRVNRGSQLSSMAEPRHSIPDNWMWAPIGMIFYYDAGTKTEPKILEQNSWLLELEDLEKDTGRLLTRSTVSDRKPQSTKSKFQANDILYGKLRPYLNKVFVADRAGYSSTEIVALRPILPFCSEYCKLALRRPDFVEYVTRLGQGTKMPRLRTEDAVIAPFPLPPLAEQHRIVAKVDELMALCDQLEAARQERMQGQQRLVAASLQRLNQPAEDPDTFRQQAGFALQVLPRLTTTAAEIKQLRQTILNLAVRGKLVEQDPEDEPAEELLSKISQDLAAFTLQRRSRSEVKSVLTPGERPFTLPPEWRWVRLDELFRVITDGDHQPPPKASEGVSFLTIGNISGGTIDFKGCRFVSNEYFDSLDEIRTPEHGDILYTVVGATYGRPVIVTTKRPFCVQRHIAILKPSRLMNSGYLLQLLSSPFIYSQATSSLTGTAQPTVALRPLRSFLAPLPPLAEQHRIVAKVDELMALCDKLEQQLSQADQQRRRLLEAVLAEALGGRLPTAQEESHAAIA